MKKVLFILIAFIAIIVIVILGNLHVFQKSATHVSQGVPISIYNQNRQAVLIIDIQEGSTGEVSIIESYKKSSGVLINKVNLIIKKANQNNIEVIYIRNEVSNRLVNILNSTMAKGSKGAQLDHRLDIINDHIISKQKQDAFSNKELDSILVNNKINSLYVVGLDAAFCIKSTIEAAKNRNYKIALISDAVISETDSLKTEMINYYINNGIEVINIDDFFKAIEKI